MSNSPLVDLVRYSPFHTPMTDKVNSVITIHHVGKRATAEEIGSTAQSRGGAANYGIGCDGKVILCIDECNSSHASSSQTNDRKAVTIEVSNSDTGGDYPVSDEVLEKLIQLCVDICQRNGIPYLNFTGDVDGNMTMHAWVGEDSNYTGCPGQYLASRFPQIANEVNRRLGSDFHSPDKPSKYERGDAVQLKPGALYYDNHLTPDWLQGKMLYIRNVYGKYYDVSVYAEGDSVTGRVHEKYLVSLEEPEEPETETPAAAALPIGSIIQLSEDAVYTTGRAVPEWVHKSTLYLRDWLTEHVIAFSVFREGGITGFVDVKYVVLEDKKDEPAEPAPELPAPEEVQPETDMPEKDEPDTEAPGAPYKVTVTIVEERNGFGKMENGGWIPLK